MYRRYIIFDFEYFNRHKLAQVFHLGGRPGARADSRAAMLARKCKSMIDMIFSVAWQRGATGFSHMRRMCWQPADAI